MLNERILSFTCMSVFLSPQNEIERITESDDGMFWMSFEDMVKNFYSINVCMVRHKNYHPVPWVEHRSRFHYDYDSDELTPDSHRTYCGAAGCHLPLNLWI